MYVEESSLHRWQLKRCSRDGNYDSSDSAYGDDSEDNSNDGDGINDGGNGDRNG